MSPYLVAACSERSRSAQDSCGCCRPWAERAPLADPPVAFLRLSFVENVPCMLESAIFYCWIDSNLRKNGRVYAPEAEARGCLAESRLKQVFKFLKDLNLLRNPVPRDLAGYPIVIRIIAWPSHPCISVDRSDRDREKDGSADEVDTGPLISVRRPRVTPCPKPPEALTEWLQPGWQSVAG